MSRHIINSLNKSDQMPPLYDLENSYDVTGILRENGEIPSNFYWILDQKIAGSAYPISQDQYSYLYNECNVRLIINLSENIYPTENQTNNEIINFYGTEHAHVDANILSTFSDLDMTIIRYPIVDGHTPTNKKTFIKLLQRINKVISSGFSVLIHCWQGKNRTALLGACYLMRFCKKNVKQSTIHIRQKSPGSLFLPNYIDFLERNLIFIKILF